MTSAREDIFANVRRSLGVTGAEAPRRADVTARLQSTPAGLIPARGQLDGQARIAMFKNQAERAQAAEAMRAIGSKATPFLLRALREQHSLFERIIPGSGRWLPFGLLRSSANAALLRERAAAGRRRSRRLALGERRCRRERGDGERHCDRAAGH